MVVTTWSQAWLSTLVFLSVSLIVASQGYTCDNSCADYNSILANCESDSESDYDSCVCNDPNFDPYVAECITCEGTNSDPYQFQQTCKTVAPDCTVACQGFSFVLQDCGDTSAAGFGACICAGAYDQTYSNTFSQDFQDCVACENGGGQAADWEAYCCALTHNCNGMSPQASAEAATVQVPSTTTPPAASSTQPNVVSTATSSGGATSHWVVNVLGSGLGQVVLNALIAIF